MLSRTYQMSTRLERAAPPRSIPRIACFGACPAAGWTPRSCATRSWPSSGQLDTDDGRDAAARPSPFQDLSATGVARKPTLYQSTRRSVYLPVLRGALYDMFQAFDFPDPAVSNGDRATTTVASQALFMMNGR